MKRQTTVARAIVHCLKRQGITKYFCVPGESYLPLLDALYDEEDVTLISARHESGAAFMAEAYGKCTSKPGVVLATRGVGAGNLAIGVHTAFQDSTPMIVILGQVHRKVLGKEGFQEVDLSSFFAPIAKWTVEVTDPERIGEIMTKAIRVSQSGRPGPVVVSIPEDVFAKEIEMRDADKIFVRPMPHPSVGELENVAKLLNQSRHPVVIAGGGIKHARAEKELLEFSESLNLPIFVSFRRHDVFPHDHEHFSGHLGLAKSGHIEAAFQAADVVIALGTRLSEVTTKDYTLLSDKHRLIHVDISEQVLGKAFEPDVGIVSDAKQFLLAMKGMEIEPKWQSWTKRVKSSYRAEREQSLQMAEKTINTHVIKTLEQWLPEDAVLTNDAGNFAGWLHEFYTFKKPNTYVGPTSGAMGYGLPSAIGAKLAFPDKTVVALTGDGGFMMTAEEVETAVRYHIPVICLVFNNSMYGTIRMHQEMHYPNRVIGTDLGDVSFSKMAESMGAKGVTVKTKNEFLHALKDALQHEKVTVIEIITDPEQISVKQRMDELRK